MPATPFEIMLGKIVPNIAIGVVQSAAVLIAATQIFGVPMLGSVALLAGRPVSTSRPIWRWATRFPPWRKTSCRRCR
jgi:ABC-type Na+ efflux pump permease subunit